MKTLLNTLYVQARGAYLRLELDTLKVEIEDKTKLQIPLHHLGALVLFGEVMVSPAVLARCAQDGRSVTWLSRSGRFQGRLEGPVSGNVLLRRAQHETLSDPLRPLELARHFVAGKLINMRHSVLRSARETDNPGEQEVMTNTSRRLALIIKQIPGTKDLEKVRGLEGEGTRSYFETFSLMVRTDRQTFQFKGRNRRPPLDPINALLSFLYALLSSDCAAAAQGVGLDPQVGFLHALRPGRPALALDLMEELRPVLADRLALTLINRRQVTAKDFDDRPGGAVLLNEAGRKKVVVAYQERKQEEISHQVLEQKMPLGLVPHIQARLLARYLRGDLPGYPPFLYR